MVSELSLFLAKAIGLYCTVAGLALVLNPQQFRAMVDELTDSPSLIAVSGAIALIIGILIVLTHNVWVADWPVLITIMGWLSLIKGIVRWTAPDKMRVVAQLYKTDNSFYITGGLLLGYGLILSYLGFYAG